MKDYYIAALRVLILLFGYIKISHMLNLREDNTLDVV